jgi:signal transduction histidine kinase/ligand-binding sensor domain-containing protein
VFKAHCWLLFVMVSFAGKAFPATEPLAVEPDALPVSADYVLRTWGVDEGLPSNRVTSLTQTPDGYLWMATQGGLARFDGVRFTTFHSEDTPGLESDRVKAVFSARDGNLWVGTDGGAVARMVNRRFQMITRDAERAGPAISFAQDASGAVWFGYETPTKVVRWLEGQLTTYTEKDGIRWSHQNEVCSTVNGTIWYANTVGCGSFDGKRFRSIDPQGGGNVHLARAADGGMWAKRGNRLVRYHPDGSQESKADVSALSVHVMMEDSSGNLWVGTNNAGLIRLRDGHWEKVPVEGSAVSVLSEDREGNLWAGLRSGGVIRLHPRRFYLRQIKDGLTDNDTSSVCADHEGRLWLAGRNHMLVRATDATNRSFTQPDGWPDWVRGTMAVHPDLSGGVWFGTHTGLLRYSAEGRFIRESLRDPVTALLVDRTGDLWAATINGPLVRHHAGQDLRMPEAGGLTHVLALAEDPVGRIWAGTEEGLVFQKSGEQFVPVSLPGAKPGNMIQFIVPDGPNTVWIGAWGGGLYRWRDGRVDRLPSETGLPMDDLRSLIITAEEDFWVGTSRGLLRVARDEIEAVMDGRLPSLHCIAYGRDDGLPSIEFSQGFRNATTKTPDGHLWFATTQGALEITPEEETSRITTPLPVLIETVRVSERAMDFVGNSELSIPPRSGPLEIRYTLAQLSASERVRFRYRLSGLGSGEWVDADRQRTALFTYLPPGDYRFEVAAAGADGLWLPATASLAFTMRAAWWETNWFRSGVGLLGVLALAALVKFAVKRRMRARMRQLKQQHALEKERARIARDMHDDVGASLTQIAIASQLARLDPPEEALGHIDEIAGIARRTVTALDEIVWAVNPRNDTLPALLEYLGQHAVDFLTAAGVACEIDMSPELPPYPLAAHVRHHLFLAVKESLNNVVKHAAASAVKLNVELGENRLRVIITDNGRGFEAGHERAGSDGLRNIRERMAELGGECRIESRPEEGTRVVFELPLLDKRV